MNCILGLPNIANKSGGKSTEKVMLYIEFEVPFLHDGGVVYQVNYSSIYLFISIYLCYYIFVMATELLCNSMVPVLSF